MAGYVQRVSKIVLQLTLLAGVAYGDGHMFPAGKACVFGGSPDANGVCEKGVPPMLQLPEGRVSPATCVNTVDMVLTMRNESETAGVRCFSPSTNISETPQGCPTVNYTEAVDICSHFRGKGNLNLTDFRLPESVAEAGQGCGSGCGFDGVEVWFNFVLPPSEAPTGAPTTSSPTTLPTDTPTGTPTHSPTDTPTATNSPTSPTVAPTSSPTTDSPTANVTMTPTEGIIVSSPTPPAPTPTSAATRLTLLPFYLVTAVLSVIALC